jgi:hypothetical protein
LLTVVHVECDDDDDEYAACAEFETKDIPAITPYVDNAIAVVKQRTVVGFILLQKYSNYHMHI